MLESFDALTARYS